MAEQKSSNKEKLKEIIFSIETGIQELFQSEKFADYLRTMSRFHKYSVNNTILIHLQRPNAAMPVAGFRKWQQFGRYVKMGEKGLTIIAPTPFKKKIEEIRLDPDTKAPVLDQDGNAIMDEKIIEIPLFKPVKVFSADQTDGEPLPSLVAGLSGDVQQYEAFMEALRRTSPMPIVFGQLEPGTDGLCSFTKQTISIQEGMSQVQTVCATVHEIGHAVLHDREKDRLSAAAGNTDKEPPKAKDERTMEVEAESVSFAVCQYYGIDTSANSLGYIAGWSKDKSLPELKASLETITKAVSGLISSIDKHFAEICKERGIDLTAQPDQTTPPPAEQPEEPQRDTALDEYPMPDQLFTTEELRQDYVTGARARGVAEWKVLWWNVFPNALLPLITLLGLSLGSLLGGAAVVEVIFSYPGLGSLAVSAITAYDYPLIQGYVLWISLIYMLVNLAVDVSYAYIDPRIREKRRVG